MQRSHLPVEPVLAVDDLKLDRVERVGRRIEPTSKEFCLLEYLMRNAGRRITRAMIIEHVSNLSFDTCTNVADVGARAYIKLLGSSQHRLIGIEYDLSCALRCGQVEVGFRTVGEYLA